MKLNAIYADAVLRNKRIQHVLEKLGFIQTHEDDIEATRELLRAKGDILIDDTSDEKIEVKIKQTF